jgi:hypothetical protein
VATYTSFLTEGLQCGLWSLQERRQHVIFAVELGCSTASKQRQEGEINGTAGLMFHVKGVIACSLPWTLE